MKSSTQDKESLPIVKVESFTATPRNKESSINRSGTPNSTLNPSLERKDVLLHTVKEIPVSSENKSQVLSTGSKPVIVIDNPRTESKPSSLPSENSQVLPATPDSNRNSVNKDLIEVIQGAKSSPTDSTKNEPHQSSVRKALSEVSLPGVIDLDYSVSEREVRGKSRKPLEGKLAPNTLREKHYFVQFLQKLVNQLQSQKENLSRLNKHNDELKPQSTGPFSKQRPTVASKSGSSRNSSKPKDQDYSRRSNPNFSAMLHSNFWVPRVKRNSHYESLNAGESYRMQEQLSHPSLGAKIRYGNVELELERSRVFQSANVQGYSNNHPLLGNANQELDLSHTQTRALISTRIQNSEKILWEGILGLSHFNFSKRDRNPHKNSLETLDQGLKTMGTKLSLQTSQLTRLQARYLRGGVSRSAGEIQMDEFDLSVTQKIQSLFFQLGYRSMKLNMEENQSQNPYLVSNESWEGPYFSLLWNLR